MEDSKKANLGQELEDDQLDDTAGGIYADTFPKAPCECCGDIYPTNLLTTSTMYPRICKRCYNRIKERSDFFDRVIVE